jgi:hypothetical protein
VKRSDTFAWNRLALAAVLLVLTGAPQLFASGEAELWERWTVSDEASSILVDHSPWQVFLDRYRYDGPDGVALVRYGEVSEADFALLDGYVESLEAVEVDDLNSREQFAYWVNLYNAATVRLILSEYPLSGIRRIPGAGLTSIGPWDLKLLTVAGEELSLDDIEHRILRPRWQDPRVHFVVNCASIGCPDLPARALSAANAEEVMERAARRYLSHPRGVRLDGRRLVLSSIFDWFARDFGSGEEEILEFIDRYRDIDADLEEIGRQRDNVPIRYEYDWSLNDG